MLQPLGKDIWSFSYQTTLAGIHFDCTSFIIQLEGKLAVISPGRWEDALLKPIQKLGEVAFLIAPNAFHHMNIATWKEKFPQAELWGVKALEKKRPDLKFDHFLKDQDQPFGPSLNFYPLLGASAVSEVVFYHPISQSLILTDLLFNVSKVRGVVTNLFFSLYGINKKLGMSRLFKFTIKDKAKFSQAIDQILELDFTQVLINHGDNLTDGAKLKFREALKWLKR